MMFSKPIFSWPDVRGTRTTLLLTLGLLLTLAAPAQDKSCALVLMHGKWGSPQYLAVFARNIDPTCTVKSLDMPWSGRRSYDEPYPVALQEIEAQVQAFRAEGFRRVLVGGQSFGANAALAYMATVGNADGVLALAPGHSPRFSYDRGIGKTEVDEARTLIMAGKGSERLSMDDLNQGKRRNMRMSANTLLSYFDPDGLGHMPGTSAAFKKAVPVLWVIGTADPLYPAGETYAYAKLPPHPQSQYLVVQAGHADTPDVATNHVVAWLKTLD